MIYSFDIDEKSLFRGIINDYKRGHTATIATPLNQSKNPEKWRNDIYKFMEGYPSMDINSLPAILKDKCLKLTTSTAKCELIKFYVFSNFLLDGVPFNVNASFAMCVKEEISEVIVKRDGSQGTNTHLGRQRLSYPMSLKHFTDGYNIDNGIVLDRIIEENGGFAYIVKGFEVDTESKTLNFRTTMVGLKGVPLSNVFIRKKGVGTKLIVDGLLSPLNIQTFSSENISKEEKNSFFATLDKIQKSSRENGKTGEKYVFENIKKFFKKEDVIEDVVHVSDTYPQSPYDIECIVNGKKQYIEVKSTKGTKKEFYMSKGERLFMDKYENNYFLVLVTDVKSTHKKHIKFYRKDIKNEAIMQQECQSIKFIVKC